MPALGTRSRKPWVGGANLENRAGCANRLSQNRTIYSDRNSGLSPIYVFRDLCSKPAPKGCLVNVAIRPAVPADIEACGRIIYKAFKGVAERHGFPPHFPGLEVAIRRADFCIRHPSIFGVVAESAGQVIGSNFLDERDPIRGLGPVTVDPEVQVRGIGRRLMEVVLED